MRRLLELVMTANAALFFFGAVQHAGVAIGPLHEPRILPASIVETLCGMSLLYGAASVWRHSRIGWRVALITNLFALSGVLLGIAALALGAGPRTSSNDLYHLTMLFLIGASIALLLIGRSRLGRRANPFPNRS
jgi:hypothetical protein